MGRLAAGHNEVEIPSRDSTDEIGAMARSVEVFKQNAIARKQADRRIRFMAHHDTLTGLTNRARLLPKAMAFPAPDWACRIMKRKKPMRRSTGK